MWGHINNKDFYCFLYTVEGTVLYGTHTGFLTRFWEFGIFLGRIFGGFWGWFLEDFLGRFRLFFIQFWTMLGRRFRGFRVYLLDILFVVVDVRHHMIWRDKIGKLKIERHNNVNKMFSTFTCRCQKIKTVNL